MVGRDNDRNVLVKCGCLLYIIVKNGGRLPCRTDGHIVLVGCGRLVYISCYKMVVACISVQQKDLVKDVMVCGDVLMSTYKTRHPDDTDDPQDVGLSSDNEVTGMGEEIGISRRIMVSHPDRSVSPPYSQGRVVTPPAEDRAPSTGTSGPSGEPPASFVRLGPDEVVIKKAVLHGIKRGAELVLEGHMPTAFSMGLASAGDVPFAIPKPSKHEVHCTFCRKDFPFAKALRWHLRMHAGKSVYVCSRCGWHLASRATMEMHQ